MELIPWVVNIVVCNVLSNILHCMLSISIAVITSLHCALFIYLKNFFHSYHSMLCSFLTIKKEVFNDMQHVYELTPLKIIKVCTTRWLTHGEACLRIISGFEPLMDALDVIYNEKRCQDVKGVRDALWLPQNICMLLLVAELLVTISYFSKFLQTRNLNCSSIKNKLGSVIEHSKLFQEGLEDYDVRIRRLWCNWF